MKKWSKLLLFSLIYTFGFAQDADLDAFLDIQRNESGHAVINGKVQSKSDKAMAFSYSMRLEKSAPSGNAISTQSGSFTLLPEEKKAISEVTINLFETSYFIIVLKIFDDERIVAEKKLISDQKFLTDFKKLIPQKTIAGSVTPEKNKTKTRVRNNTDVLEIEGLIIDETRSKSGRDFYDHFYSKWIAPDGISDFTITIRELPARGRAAMVAVELNGNLLIQRMLQPRQDIIELLAEQSVNVIKAKLTENKNLKSEIENGDQKGSGIY